LACILELGANRVEAQQAQFDAFMAGFRDKVKASFDIDPGKVTGDVEIFITKSLAARLIAEAVNRGNAAVGYSLANEASFVPEPFDIQTEDKADAHLECSPDQFCNYGCDSQWPWEKAGCEIGKTTCKAGQKLDCERRKSMAKLISAKKVATVSFREVTISGSASAQNVKIEVAPALDSLSLSAALAARITLSCSGHLAPEPLIIAVGCLPHDFNFHDEPVQVNESSFSLRAGVDITAEGDQVVVSVKPEKPTVTLHFAGTPVLRFIARNPLAVLACPIPYVLGGIADLAAPRDMAKKEVDLPLPSLQPRVGSLSAPAGSLPMSVEARVTSRAVGLVGSVVKERP
jgi:hypothetical protein